MSIKNNERLHSTQEALYSLLKDPNNEGLTLREIAPQIGVKSPNTVSHHINQLEKKGYISRDTSGNIRMIHNPGKGILFLNLYGMAGCGPDGFFSEDRVIDRIPLPSKTFKVTNDSFLVEASGDSMYPVIKEGDLVLAEKGIDPENGDMVVVIHNDQAKIKKIFREDNGLILQSINPAYPPIGAYSDQNLNICGVVTGVVQKFSTFKV
jgi:repressor LexA